MNDILKKIEPANDLEIKENINSPTILVENMSLAGIWCFYFFIIFYYIFFLLLFFY